MNEFVEKHHFPTVGAGNGSTDLVLSGTVAVDIGEAAGWLSNNISILQSSKCFIAHLVL